MNLDIEVPFIEKSKIKKEARRIREETDNEEIPVEIRKIIEIHFEIDIIPRPSLQDDCDVDALIMSDWSTIVVDKKMHDKEKHQNRLKFSLAHELGHRILHREKWEEFNIEDMRDYREFIEKIDPKKYGMIEAQANLFAGNILIPEVSLKKERRKVLENAIEKDKRIKEIDNELLNEYLVEPLARRFKVSRDAMNSALKQLEQ